MALEEAGGGPLEAYSQAWADYLARLVPYQPPLNRSLHFVAVTFYPTENSSLGSLGKKAWPRRSSRECTVWRRSQVIGVACADDAFDYWRRQMVITFQPRGDLLGQYASNVLPPSSFDDLGEDETEAKTEEEDEELAIVTEEVEVVTQPVT